MCLRVGLGTVRIQRMVFLVWASFFSFLEKIIHVIVARPSPKIIYQHFLYALQRFQSMQTKFLRLRTENEQTQTEKVCADEMRFFFLPWSL